ncbi:MAG: copper-containing nitrite reductase [Anaerolineae bacterium]|jgi:nitrite reductase (NO-forming)|nr:copper-containing nitrite reductase [Anaerolineae bacterium]
MSKQLSSNFVAVVVGAITFLVLALLPIRIELITVDAQEQTAVARAQAHPHNETVSAQAQTVEFTLRMVIGGTPAMAFVGVGGAIDGVVNPELVVNQGDTVRLTVINGDPVLHDLKIDEFGAYTGEMNADEQTVVLEFVASQAGDFEYYCSIPGHRDIGMKGVFRVIASETTTVGTEESQPAGDYTAAVPAAETTAAPAIADAVSIVRNPADVPPSVGDRGPQTVRFDLNAVEVNGILADGSTYRYMTFDGQVPGPMLRVREGDTVEIYLANQSDSQLPHSIDLHSVTGPGGGAVYTQTMPGGETSFTFQALQPGLYVYHCATPSVAHHITSGMYGLILVEPAGGLPTVDREFYVMQGEIYTEQPFGTTGHLDFSHEKMLDEDPEFYVFNGAAGGLAQDEFALRAEVGETVRIYFGVGGPNATSSFHVIGEIFDRVYDQASITAPPLTDVQTTTVAPGGATMVEFALEVPGRYILVDHALSRLERGLVGFLYVDGADNPAVFHSDEMVNDAGH